MRTNKRNIRKLVAYEPDDENEAEPESPTLHPPTITSLSFLQEDDLPLTNKIKPKIQIPYISPQLTPVVHKKCVETAECVEIVEYDTSDEWEDQQARKGVSRLMETETEDQFIPPEKSLADIRTTLQHKLTSLRERSSGGIGDMKETIGEAKERLNMIKECRPQLDKKYIFYQEMKNYSLTLIDCINDKIAMIDQVVDKSIKNPSETIGDRCDIFCDASEEYSSVTAICSMFERWKMGYRDTYEEAHIGLCLCKLLIPHVRLEMVEWNPLEDDCVPLGEFTWAKTLAVYCADQSDPTILSWLVEKVVFPRMNDIVSSWWDPRCGKTTANLCGVVSRIMRTYPSVAPSCGEVNKFFGLVRQKVDDLLAKDVSIPLYNSQALEDRQSQAAVFFFESLWKAVRLFNSVGYLHAIMSGQLMADWTDKLLNNCILPALGRIKATQEVVLMCWELASALTTMGLDSLMLGPFTSYCCNLAVLVNSLKLEDYRNVHQRFVIVLRDLGASDLSDMLNDFVDV